MNAADNPFRTARVERLLAFDPGLVGTSWAEIEDRWETLGRRTCVTGRHGAGKTTFLDAFASRLAGRIEVRRLFFNDGKTRLDESDRRLLRDPEAAVLLVDGDRHLRTSGRREIEAAAAKAAGFLSARHRPGGLAELIRLRPTPALAAALLARIAPDAQVSDLAARLRRKRGNLRELWLESYDRAARNDFEINTFWKS